MLKKIRPKGGFCSGRFTNPLQYIEYMLYFLFTPYLESFRQGFIAVTPTLTFKTENFIIM